MHSEWKLGNVIYTTNKEDQQNIWVTKIQKLDKFYVAIDPKLELDNKQLEICQNALSNNVKFIKNNSCHSIIELWIKDDLRIFTHNIYKGLDGKYLIVFSKKGTHKDVKKSLGPLKIIDLSNEIYISSDSSEDNSDNNINDNNINNEETNVIGESDDHN